MKMFNNNKKLPKEFCWFIAIICAIAIAVLFFTQWGLEWYQENEMEWDYGIFSIVFLILHLIPFFISVVGGGIVGFIIGGIIALALDALVFKLCEKQVNSSGKRILLTKPRKVLIIIVAIICSIFAIIGVNKAIEKNTIRNEITDYLTTEYGLKDVEIKFTSPNSDVWDYGVVVYSSNLDSLTYEKMTRIEYYLTSHTDLGSCDVNVERYMCGDNTYRIFTTSVYKNGDCVYEYNQPPSSSITNADAPYVGMDAKYIGSTKLGSPDKTERCRDYAALRPERRTITYKWYDSNGKMIYYAFVINDKVTSVTDYRK